MTWRHRTAQATIRVSTWYFLLAVAVLAGTYLRWTQLRGQVLLDDEWHAVHILIVASPGYIATHFGFADYSIPLTLGYQWLYLHGGLSEWSMHLPMLLAGVSLLVIAPMLAPRGAGRPALALWVALLAISPLLVYHSRIARPYALTSVLCFIAIVSFRRFWRDDARIRTWGALYGVTAALAGYLHPVTLVFTLVPFPYYVIGSLIVRSPNAEHASACKRIRRAVILGFCTALALVLALAPPLLNAWSEVTDKALADPLAAEGFWRTLSMLFGVSSSLLLALLLVVAAAGAKVAWNRERDWPAYIATIFVVGVTAIALVRPMWINHPLVLARYLLLTLPFLLLFLAEGAVAAAALASPAALRIPFLVLIPVLLFAAGPIPSYLYYPNQFMGHLRFQFDYDRARNPYVTNVPKDPVPDFYRQLGKAPPGSLTLIEAPWRLESHFNPLAWYQEVHRQNVKIGLVTPVCGVRRFGEYPETVRGLRFRQMAHLSAILAGDTYGADFLVMHLHPWKMAANDPVEWPDVESCLGAIEPALGPPVYRDAAIVVFALRKKAAKAA